MGELKKDYHEEILTDQERSKIKRRWAIYRSIVGLEGEGMGSESSLDRKNDIKVFRALLEEEEKPIN